MSDDATMDSTVDSTVRDDLKARVEESLAKNDPASTIRPYSTATRGNIEVDVRARPAA